MCTCRVSYARQYYYVVILLALELNTYGTDIDIFVDGAKEIQRIIILECFCDSDGWMDGAGGECMSSKPVNSSTFVLYLNSIVYV